jgi:hypothetical protein
MSLLSNKMIMLHGLLSRRKAVCLWCLHNLDLTLGLILLHSKSKINLARKYSPRIINNHGSSFKMKEFFLKDPMIVEEMNLEVEPMKK